MSMDGLPLTTDELAAELNAAFLARQAALELERHYASADQDSRLDSNLKQLGLAEEKLKSLDEGLHAAVSNLGALAVAEAESLEADAAEIEPLLGPSAAGRKVGVLRLVSVLQHLARLGEGQTRAFCTFARQGRPIPDAFNEALQNSPEHELYFLALRRFEALLKAGAAWSLADADWLRLRAADVPGRLRQRAAGLRVAAQTFAGVKLPPEMEEMSRPFLERGFRPGEALAWAVAGFTLKQAFSWQGENIYGAAQAQAWRDRGMDADEAGAWISADFTPDEAAAYKACGAEDPATALDVRRWMGDVDRIAEWHRADFSMPELLRLAESGVRNLAEAVAKREAAAKADSEAAAARAASPPPAPAPQRSIHAADLAPDPAPASSALEDKDESAAGGEDRAVVEKAPAVQAKPKPSKPAHGPEAAPPQPVEREDWAQQRALHSLEVTVWDQAAALAAVPENGGAWMGWGAFEPQAKEGAGGAYDAYTLPMAGGLMDVVAQSEGVALPTRSHAPFTLDAPSDWQERLDRLREARGKGTLPGQWYLSEWAPARAYLFWGLAFNALTVPWGQAIDFFFHETWRQRWARRVDEFGQKNLECPCTVGKTDRGAYWVAITPSLVATKGAPPAAIRPPAEEVLWRAQMEDFCLKIGMSVQPCKWHLVAGREKDD
jgi:hypothetical protein